MIPPIEPTSIWISLTDALTERGLTDWDAEYNNPLKAAIDYATIIFNFVYGADFTSYTPKEKRICDEFAVYIEGEVVPMIINNCIAIENYLEMLSPFDFIKEYIYINRWHDSRCEYDEDFFGLDSVIYVDGTEYVDGAQIV